MTILSINSVILDLTTLTTASTFASVAILLISLLSGWTISYLSAHLQILSTLLRRKYRPNSKLPIKATLDSYLGSRSIVTAPRWKLRSPKVNFSAKFSLNLEWKTVTLSPPQWKMQITLPQRRKTTYSTIPHSIALPSALSCMQLLAHDPTSLSLFRNSLNLVTHHRANTGKRSNAFFAM